MGSRERYQDYFEQNPGVYFRSTGWLERGENLEQESCRSSATGPARATRWRSWWRDTAKRTGSTCSSELNSYQRTYQKLTYISTGLEPDGAFERKRERRSGGATAGSSRAWRATCSLFERLLCGRLERAGFPDRAAGLARDRYLRHGHHRQGARGVNGRGTRPRHAAAGADPTGLPLMPITMMFAAGHIGVKYGDYARDHRVLAEAQIRTAEDVRIRLRLRHLRPGARGQRPGRGHRVVRRPAARHRGEATPCWRKRRGWPRSQMPDPAAAPRMSDRVEGVRLLRERAGASCWWRAGWKARAP